VAGFKDRVKEPVIGTIQKVVPVKLDAQEKEVQLGVFISKTLMKSLKLKALKEDKTVKEVVNEILENNT
jgi:hypothetical protein